MTTLHITPGPDGKKHLGGIRFKFCFRCRSRTRHKRMMLYDTQPSYYDPIIRWECDRCGMDYTKFPGKD